MSLTIVLFIGVLGGYTLATEVKLPGQCGPPSTIKTVESYKLTDFNGFYGAVQYYRKDRKYSLDCYRMFFNKENAGLVRVDTAGKQLHGYGKKSKKSSFCLTASERGGLFNMVNCRNRKYLGNMYVIEHVDYAGQLVLYTCVNERKTSEHDVIVLRQDFEQLNEVENDMVQKVLKENNLDTDISEVVQDKAVCGGVMEY